MNRNPLSPVIFGLLILVGLFIISLYNYLLFHSLAELFSVVVACGIFMVAWNSRSFIEKNYLLFLGIAYLFVAAIDIMHTLSYKGMGVFPVQNANLPTQLWIAARYMEAFSLLIVPFFITRTLRIYPIFFSFALVFSGLIATIFIWPVFPDCFIEGEGLTTFKKVSEYVISVILFLSVTLLLRIRSNFDRKVLQLLIASILLTITSELFFTFYVHVYGISNLLGHFSKIISFYLIYKAIIQTGLMKPYDLLFRNLVQSQEALQKAHDNLEIMIKARTKELLNSNEELRKEISERLGAEKSLKESEKKYSSIIEESLTGVYINQDSEIIFANNRFAEIYGYKQEEIIGMNPMDMVHPDDLDMVKKARTLRLSGKNAPVEYEARGLTKTGKTIWVVRRNRLILFKDRPAILGNIADITERKLMEKELRKLSGQLLEAEENERKRIARELHDGIGQSLSAIKFSIETVLNHISAGDYERTGESLETIIPLTQGMVEEVRRIIMDLRPSILDDLGLLPTINWLCREFQAIYSNIKIEKKISISEDDISDQLKTVIYRVLQEALNNVSKHSQANLVSISLLKEKDGVKMNLEDDGIGFDLGDPQDTNSTERGFGLTNMRERTHLSGGIFSIQSTKGSGTIISAFWPLHEHHNYRDTL